MRKTCISMLAVGLLGFGGLEGCATGDTVELVAGDEPPPGPVVVGIVNPDAPPAIHGGTLFVAKDGFTAIASDPDRDQVYVVDLETNKLLHTIPLKRHDEPGRAVEDKAGNVHIALRRGGAVVTISPVTGEVQQRRAVCPAPSGMSYDAEADALHVACTTGELVTLPAAGGAVTRTLQLGPDLRDVVTYNSGGVHLLVSRLRRADVMVLDHDGGVIREIQLPDTINMQGIPVTPTVAWRMRMNESGRVHMLHQRSAVVEIPEDEGGYSGDFCAGIVQHAISEIDPNSDGPQEAAMAIPGSLLTDFDHQPSGEGFAIAATGHSWSDVGFPRLIMASDLHHDPIGCNFDLAMDLHNDDDGEIVAVAHDGGGHWIAQSRQPAMLKRDGGAVIMLSEVNRYDEGLALFHQAPPNSGMTCASCHPGGEDDGHVWLFRESGLRRTQTLAGTLAGTAPYHWDASMKDLDTIFERVFAGRMLGDPLSPEKRDAFASWLISQRAPVQRVARDSASFERGKALFEDSKVACASCHSGNMLTNNKSYDVGTGGVFQVPSLIGIGTRTTFMHDGCANTLADRFADSCGGDAHGDVSHLNQDQLSDLLTYLGTM